MNKDFEREFIAMEEWATEVQLRLGGKEKFNISSKREQILEDAILCTTFSVKTDLPSSEVTDIVVEVGANYRRGRRYFFIYDQDKRILFLLFYPYYILCCNKE